MSHSLRVINSRPYKNVLFVSFCTVLHYYTQTAIIYSKLQSLKHRRTEAEKEFFRSNFMVISYEHFQYEDEMTRGFCDFGRTYACCLLSAKTA